MRALDLHFGRSKFSAPICAILGECAQHGELRRVAVDTLEDCALSAMIGAFEPPKSRSIVQGTV
jgi:hypothetical protein